MLANEELERRRPLWTAFSQLWLDTEVDHATVRRIACAAIASGYSVEELNEIYLYEVAPVVGANLLVPAGVWSGFDTEWLHMEAGKRADARSFWLRLWVRSSLGRKLMTYATDEYWNQVFALVQAARSRPHPPNQIA